MTNFSTRILIPMAALIAAIDIQADENAFRAAADNSRFEVLYLIPRDTSVLLLCEYSPAIGNEPYLKNIDKKAVISTDDEVYALLRTTNLPFKDEADARYAYIKPSSGILHCALEFEKFPLDVPFSLIENRSDSTSLSVRGITVDMNETVQIDANQFLASTPYTEYGYYYDDGSPVYYFMDGDTKIKSTAWPYTSIHDDNYLSVGFEITNNTTSPLPFGFANIEADGLKQAKNKLKKMDIRIYSAKDADKEWKTTDYYEIMNEIPDNAGQALGRSASRAAFDSGVSAGASLGLLAAGLLLNTISEPDSEPYMKEKNEERERLMKSYLADTVINPGDTLSTFVSMKLYGVPACVNVYLKLNGETYTFNY